MVYDDEFEFRLAHKEEVPEIMTLIRDYWGNPNHILANDIDFFRYEYCPKGDPHVYIAREKSTGKIAAMHCLYLYEKTYEREKTDLATGMFLANPTVKTPFIGMELHKRVLEDLKPRSYIAPGVDMVTSAPLIRRFLHHKVERMKHFFIPGNGKNIISEIVDLSNRKQDFDERQEELVLYHDADEMYACFDDLEFMNRRPYKDRWYVDRRYFNHPIYRYSLFGIADKTVLVCRMVSVGDSRVLRIVDVLGEPGGIRYAGKALRRMTEDGGYEYIDLYEQKMDEEDLFAAGFIERKENDINIIPNYFEPFVMKNVEIWVNRKDDVTYCFKADGDQDRPNHRAL